MKIFGGGLFFLEGILTKRKTGYREIFALLFVTLTVLLSSCGQKGSLYLPDEPEKGKGTAKIANSENQKFR